LLSALPLIQTSGQFEFHDYNNVHIPNDRKYWQVTVSVTAEHDAYIVLCEGRDPFNSACYWILLGGWPRDGGRCAIRRCPDGVNRAGYATGPCRTLVDQKDVRINTKFEFMCGTVAVSVPGCYKQKLC